MGAHTTFASGTRHPARSAHTGRGSDSLQWPNAAARLPISHSVNANAQPTIANMAPTLAATANQVASPATTEFSSTPRLIISSA